jgi:hypothetical protein
VRQNSSSSSFQSSGRGKSRSGATRTKKRRAAGKTQWYVYESTFSIWVKPFKSAVPFTVRDHNPAYVLLQGDPSTAHDLLVKNDAAPDTAAPSFASSGLLDSTSSDDVLTDVKGSLRSATLRCDACPPRSAKNVRLWTKKPRLPFLLLPRPLDCSLAASY